MYFPWPKPSSRHYLKWMIDTRPLKTSARCYGSLTVRTVAEDTNCNICVCSERPTKTLLAGVKWLMSIFRNVEEVLDIKTGCLKPVTCKPSQASCMNALTTREVLVYLNLKVADLDCHYNRNLTDDQKRSGFQRGIFGAPNTLYDAVVFLDFLHF